MLLESQRVFQNHLMTGPLGNSEFYFPRISCSENKIHQVLNVGANLPLATYSLHNRLVSFNTTVINILKTRILCMSLTFRMLVNTHFLKYNREKCFEKLFILYQWTSGT